MIVTLLLALSPVVYIVLGAWIAHTARQGKSPMPQLFTPKPKPPAPPDEVVKPQRKL